MRDTLRPADNSYKLFKSRGDGDVPLSQVSLSTDNESGDVAATKENKKMDTYTSANGKKFGAKLQDRTNLLVTSGKKKEVENPVTPPPPSKRKPEGGGRDKVKKGHQLWAEPTTPAPVAFLTPEAAKSVTPTAAAKKSAYDKGRDKTREKKSAEAQSGNRDSFVVPSPAPPLPSSQGRSLRKRSAWVSYAEPLDEEAAKAGRIVTDSGWEEVDLNLGGERKKQKTVKGLSQMKGGGDAAAR